MLYLIAFCKYSSILSSMTSYSTVKYEILDNCIAVITLSRPDVANALNSQMALELNNIFSNVANNIRVIILTGEGEKVFCAGADLKERSKMNIPSWQVQHQQFRQALQSIMTCQMPVIAAVNGAAYGGGLELALGCDFIYAAKTASFALPEAKLGIMPGTGGTQNLANSIGIRHAKELLFTGKSFSAAEAYNLGMVNKICEPELLMEEVNSCARLIIANAPLSVNSIKLVVNQGSGTSLKEGLLTESSHYNRLISTKDRIEGIAAFNEKRQPKFSGS